MWHLSFRDLPDIRSVLWKQSQSELCFYRIPSPREGVYKTHPQPGLVHTGGESFVSLSYVDILKKWIAHPSITLNVLKCDFNKNRQKLAMKIATFF